MTWTAGLYVFYQRLTQKSSSNFSQSVCVCACAKWMCVCMHAFIWASWTSPSLTATQLHQHSPFNAPSHISVCVRDAEKWSPRTFQLWTNAEMRRSPEKPEREEKNRKDGDGEQRDSYKERLRGQTSEKVEWDIWKRESHWDQEEIAAAQQWFIGENSALHLPLVLQPFYLTLSPLHTLLLPTWNDWSQQFCMSRAPSKTIWNVRADWYFDTKACPLFPLQWPEHEQHQWDPVWSLPAAAPAVRTVSKIIQSGFIG